MPACRSSAQAGGYLIHGRNFDANVTKYKFTGKERDKESNYDYFGARYYDSRIGRWGSIDPAIDKYPSFSPYNYVFNNSLKVIDPDGKDPYRKYLASYEEVAEIIAKNSEKSWYELGSIFGNSDKRYLYTEEGGFIDLKHFFKAAHIADLIGKDIALIAGTAYEILQSLGVFDENSAYDPEDPPSNYLGVLFGIEKSSGNKTLDFLSFIQNYNPLHPDDSKIASDKIYIPYDEKDRPLPRRNSFEPYHGEDPNYGKQTIKKE